MPKGYNWKSSTCICDDSKYFKSIVDGSVIVCGEIMSVTNNVSRFVTNTVLPNVVNTASINSVNKKVR